MTFIDRDKDSLERGAPLPNRHDAVDPGAMMSRQSISSSYTRTGNVKQQPRMRMVNNALVWYDDQNRISAYDGYIPSLSPIPVRIDAKYGYDVFVDILGISRPAGL